MHIWVHTCIYFLEFKTVFCLSWHDQIIICKTNWGLKTNSCKLDGESYQIQTQTRKLKLMHFTHHKHLKSCSFVVAVWSAHWAVCMYKHLLEWSVHMWDLGLLCGNQKGSDHQRPTQQSAVGIPRPGRRDSDSLLIYRKAELDRPRVSAHLVHLQTTKNRGIEESLKKMRIQTETGH